MPELGELEDVGLREAWDHEAHSFTPWLTENLDKLSAEIGIPLELEGREVAVGDFSADILARNPIDDSLVLIENQLEVANHTHLGQVLTYLPGLDAKVVIWIAAKFRDEHLSAINWLNEHTVEPFAFFAVRIRVVRIGDSPLAPVFEVLARPNEWNRRLHAIAQESRQISELGQFRQKFWKHFVERHPNTAEVPVPYAGSSYWRRPTKQELYVAQYVGRNAVGLFIRPFRGGDPQTLYDHLNNRAEWLDERLDVVIGQPGSQRLYARHLKVDMSDQSKWDEAADWLMTATHNYEAALKELFEETV